MSHVFIIILMYLYYTYQATLFKSRQAVASQVKFELVVELASITTHVLTCVTLHEPIGDTFDPLFK